METNINNQENGSSNDQNNDSSYDKINENIVKNKIKAVENACKKLLLEYAKEEERKYFCIPTHHEKISKSVFRHLSLRYTQLEFLKTSAYNIFKEYPFKDKYNRPIDNKDLCVKLGNQISFKYAMTDLFVEKALEYLDTQAKRYTIYGTVAYSIGILSVILGLFIAANNYFDNFHFKNTKDINHKYNTIEVKIDTSSSNNYFSIHYKEIKNGGDGELEILRSANIDQTTQKEIFEIINEQKSRPIIDKIFDFTKAFTFYGFIVIIAVSLWRLGRAFLDQAERLHEKRHSLRQGRLFVHLHDGEMTIEQLIKSFDWNMSKSNAFSDINIDHKAPWGAVLTEFSKALTETIKTTIEHTSKNLKKE